MPGARGGATVALLPIPGADCGLHCGCEAAGLAPRCGPLGLATPLSRGCRNSPLPYDDSAEEPQMRMRRPGASIGLPQRMDALPSLRLSEDSAYIQT